jgi:hypothetical protein
MGSKLQSDNVRVEYFLRSDFAETRLPSFWSFSTGTSITCVKVGQWAEQRSIEVLKQKWTVIDLVRYLWQWEQHSSCTCYRSRRLQSRFYSLLSPLDVFWAIINEPSAGGFSRGFWPPLRSNRRPLFGQASPKPSAS